MNKCKLKKSIGRSCAQGYNRMKLYLYFRVQKFGTKLQIKFLNNLKGYKNDAKHRKLCLWHVIYFIIITIKTLI